VAEARLLITAGDQVPLIPLSEIAGSRGAVEPKQSDKVFPKLNIGSSIGLTVTARVNLPMHCSGVASAVKIYTPDTSLSMMAGSQIPSIPLMEVVGNKGTSPPVHMVNVGSRLNVGAML